LTICRGGKRRKIAYGKESERKRERGMEGRGNVTGKINPHLASIVNRDIEN